MKLIFNFICLFIILQFTLFGIFLWIHPKGDRKSNKILGLFLFSFSIYLLYIPFLNKHTGIFYPYFSNLLVPLFRIVEPFRFLFGPLLLLYTGSLLSHDFKLKKRHLFHSIPFFLDYIILIFFYYIQPLETKLAVLSATERFPTGWLKFNFAFYYTQHVIYLIICLIIIQKYQQQIKDAFSNLSKIKLSWLKIIIFIFLISWGIDLFNSIGNLKIFNAAYYQLMDLVSSITILLLANLMVFRGLRHPHMFIRSHAIQKEKYKKSPLTDKLKKTYLDQLQTFMQQNKPHLKDDITLPQLADQCSIPRNYLSQVINEELKVNFYIFINNHRIEEAKAILSDPRKKKKSVTEIMYEVGFNSRSTFFTLFQRATGTTPAKFRKKHL